MNKHNLLMVAMVIAAIGLFASSPRLRSLIGLQSSEIVTIQRGSQSTVNSSAESASGGESAGPVEEEYELITLLPKDAIRSIDNPEFVTGAEADEQYSPDELVLGVEINGDARAYSIPYLSGREIVNDVVGGEPIAVTW